MQFLFQQFALDPARRRLTASGEPVAIPDRQLEILLVLVARDGQIVSKDELLEAGWKDVAVGDNSLEQVISSLRRLLGPGIIETVSRRGYRFVAPITRAAARESDAELDALLAPHRAFIEGRAALETLERDHVVRARQVFERAIESAPEHASAHIGLANACAMQFEMTRVDPQPDVDTLSLATHHAREACRLDSQASEAWATLGFVLGRAGSQVDALAAARRAVSLEPGNWRHHIRLAYTGWGEERLHSARRTLALLPGLPLAHWLAATVFVARQVLDDAVWELTTGIASEIDQRGHDSRFSSVALHWLLGLIHLARGDHDGALEQFELELASEASGHLYARECCANTYYAMGALHLRQGRNEDAASAFRNAIARVATHRSAQVGLAAATAHTRDAGRPSSRLESESMKSSLPFEAALAWATQLATADAHDEAARVIDTLLASAPPGNAGWLLPVEPLLNVAAHAGSWSRPLARVRNRAA